MKKKSADLCVWIGCQHPARFFLRHNWGKNNATKNVWGVCIGHSPEWVRDGRKKSDPKTIFGITKSWYTLVERKA